MTGLVARGTLDLHSGLMGALTPTHDYCACVINLSKTRFVTPSGLVAIMCLATAAQNSGHEVRVVPPPDGSDCSKYLFRMELPHRLREQGITTRMTEVRAHDTGFRLLEVTRFEEATGPDVLGQRVFQLARESLGETEAETLYTAVTEAAGNVMEHSSDRDPIGFLALQSFPGSGRAQFAIGDPGCGLRASLAHALPVASDQNAIEKAMTDGVSGTGLRGRGKGLPTIRQLATRQFDLASGASCFTEGQRRVRWEATRNGVSLPGTILSGTFDT